MERVAKYRSLNEFKETFDCDCDYALIIDASLKINFDDVSSLMNSGIMQRCQIFASFGDECERVEELFDFALADFNEKGGEVFFPTISSRNFQDVVDDVNSWELSEIAEIAIICSNEV